MIVTPQSPATIAVDLISQGIQSVRAYGKIKGGDARTMTLDIRGAECSWPEELKPMQEGSYFSRETFDDWWERNSSRLVQLHPMIAEQWVYRHWTLSPYCHLPLEQLRWRLEEWSTQQILRDVFIADINVDAEHDFKVFNEFGGIPPAPVMNATGTWDYPILVLETPSGVQTYARELPDVRYLLVEGHNRYRYLNALAAKGRLSAHHSVFVLNYPI
ncbi:hypothetical protein [Mesorhizobium sp. M0185]|uniref:hypothetical protein n=1 Tax=Mesorhizobium sp. M0185 TaxID=2956907 RepID=UPI003338EFCC